MKGYFAIFTVFTLLFIGGNFYVHRLGRWIFTDKPRRRIYNILFTVLSLSYVAGRILERPFPTGMASYVLSFVGAYWFAFLLYGGIGVFVIDIVSLSGFIRGRITGNRFDVEKPRRTGAKMVCVIVMILLVAGSINARIRPLHEITVESDNVSRPVSIVFVSDIHLGILIDDKDAKKLVNAINRVHGDMVIIGGDFVDGTLSSVFASDAGKPFAEISAPLGVFAVTGNHDYFGNIGKAVAYMRKNGIRVLQDEYVRAGEFCIVGRIDSHGAEMTGIERKSLEAIVADKSGKLPVIVVDHEPVSIEESVEKGVLLHLSGHTHAGQMWPINFITSHLFTLDCGYRVYGRTNCFVSSGYGTWGPPVRIGNRPEIVKITVVPRK